MYAHNIADNSHTSRQHYAQSVFPTLITIHEGHQSMHVIKDNYEATLRNPA